MGSKLRGARIGCFEGVRTLNTRVKRRRGTARPFLWLIAAGLLIRQICSFDPSPPAPKAEDTPGESSLGGEGINYACESSPAGDSFPAPAAQTDYSGYKAENIKVINNTDFEPDYAALLDEPLSFVTPADPSVPSVLIIHTHGSEAYSPSDGDDYSPTDTYRTADTQYNMIKVGDRIEEYFRGAGIGVIHDRRLFDYPSYNGAYTRALDAINEHLEANPSIKIVLDVHRDALITPDGEPFGSTVKQDGKKCSQVLLVVGTNEGGLAHPEWKENLKFALRLEREMEVLYPGLVRNLNLRSERFNQHATPGSLIVEVGANGNTLREALNAADLFSVCAARVIKQTAEE